MEPSVYRIRIMDFGGRRLLFDRRVHDHPFNRVNRRRRHDRRSGYDRRSVDNNIEPWDELERRNGFSRVRKLIPGAGMPAGN